MKFVKLRLVFAFATSLTGCVGAVIGVAVDTTAAVIKAPFQLAGAVIGVAADTTGTVIAAPFRMVDAAVGGTQYHHQHGHDHGSHEHGGGSHDGHPAEQYQYPANDAD